MKNHSITTNLRSYLSAVVFIAAAINAFSQVPQGFNYQAIARGSDGEPIKNATIKVKLSVLSDSTGFYAGTIPLSSYVWEEEHVNIKTNQFGLFTLTMGNPLATKIQGSASSFSTISWTPGPLFIGIKVANPTTYKIMGSARLWSAPYSLVSGSVSGPLKKLQVVGETTNLDESLFEVKNRNGQTIFAVYNEGVRVYVDNGAKGAKGGFAIGGFGEAKAPSQPLFVISPDSARIYVDETNAKGSKGGFAIGGFTAAKGFTSEFLYLAPDNYLIGHSSGKLITTGVFNSTLGYQSGKSLTEGSNNVFMGYQSGFSTTTGNSNIFIGTSSGYANSTGYWNIMLGRASGQYNSSGYANIIIGDYAGNKNTTGFRNVFIGDYAGGFNTIGENNIFVGANAGNQNTEGNFNVFIGTQAGELNTTGQWNTILGYLAGNSNTTTGSQVLLGYKAGNNNTGGWNTMVGSLAGELSGTANESTYIGLAAGQQAAGNRNVFIGRWAGRYESANSYRLIIESNYDGSDYLNNALVYGDFDFSNGGINRILRVNGHLQSSVSRVSGYAATFLNAAGTGSWGIKVQSGDASANGDMIDFYSQAGFYQGSIRMTNGVISIYGKSDLRQKENIRETSLNGLSLLKELKVVDYSFAKSQSMHTGYIAQDAEKIFPEMVAYKEKEDTYTVSYSTLIPVLHKAILEQQQQIEDQARKIAELESLVRKLLEK